MKIKLSSLITSFTTHIKLYLWSYISLLGVLFLLFSSIYFLTKSSFCSGFDLSNTGEIGDTIGGVTSPIINLLGAILVYLSFQTQIKANKLQSDLLKIEVINQRYDRNFSVALDLINSLKGDFNLLKINEFKGLHALNVYVNKINSSISKDDFKKHLRKPIFNEWKFLIFELDLIMNHLSNSELRDDEKEKLKDITRIYYATKLKNPTIILQEYLVKFELEQNLINTIKELKSYNKSQN